MADPYLTLAEMRAIPALQNTSKFPDDVLEDFVREFEELAEGYIGLAFTPREATFTHTWDRRWNHRTCPTLRVSLPHSYVTALTAASIAGEEADVDTFVIYDGRSGSIDAPLFDDFTLTYTYGLPVLPAGIKSACRLFVRWSAFYETSEIGKDGRDVTTIAGPDGGFTRFVIADIRAGRPTRFEVVNEKLNAARDHYAEPTFA